MSGYEDRLLGDFEERARREMQALPDGQKPTDEIAAKAIRDGRNGLVAFLAETQWTIEPVDKNQFGLHFPHIPPIHWPNLPLPGKKQLCIIGVIAAATALAAAWVASGGTLAIGSVVAGLTITGPIHAALVGGASGAAIASIICS
jgi:hypothetical protein